LRILRTVLRSSKGFTSIKGTPINLSNSLHSSLCCLWVIKIDRIFFSSDNFLENIRVVGLFLQGINVSYSLKKLKLQAENVPVA
jgi:hypothetical protein